MVSLLFLASFVGQAPPVPPVAPLIPAMLTIDKPGFFVLPANTQAKNVAWYLIDDGLTQIPPNLLKDTKTACFYCDKACKSRVLAMASTEADKVDFAICEITVSGPVPPPPPVPPVPPLPDNPLVAKFQLAYTSDPGPLPDKTATRARLSGLYEAVATHVDDPSLKTAEQLLGDLRANATFLKLPDMLVGLRKVIAAEVAAFMTDPPKAEMTPARKADVKAFFRQISAALDAVR